MRIQNMFVDDINRKINGVVKVGENEEAVLVQELNEYVITKELKKHFITFFNNYGDSFDTPTADTGVWISGFFGSGKSHFLKILSYLLENKEVQGVKTVERFRNKFSDDPATFMLIDKATKGKTDTILFNIDIEGSINKDKTAVLRVFAKMFYDYLGFYGEDLKVAKLEQFVSKQGKTEAFRSVFEEKNGASWLESRDAFAFFEDDIVETLQEVLGMSEQAARNWFNGTETVETSIAQLVSEIKEYVDNQPDDFRLLFMIDEVGQYVGADTDLLLNLQSLVEEIGSKCDGKVWVVCTGQEAIDEIIKARENEFSRIQARFNTRLSLSSSSADEVIQKRILKKTEDASNELEKVYNTNESVLRNLFSFTDSIMDIKGYSSGSEFSKNFPFVPYQFILMQKVFTEIRKHGNSGKHLSAGERSMLSGFQEVAQAIQDKDEYALAPFYLFYDTVHTFLDSTIRRVIERCQRAADEGNGIEPQDVKVLKLLYMIRYIDDVKANLDNIVILMADDIRLDKITMREQVRESLDRLMSQNYIGRSGDTYNFLTDEEQEIQSEIKNTTVATAEIVGTIANMVFADIYTTKKYRYGKYDFPFTQMVDEQNVGQVVDGMTLRILTVATDAPNKSELYLMAHSAGQAIVVLADNPYYESLESAKKIRKYVKQKNVSELPKSVQDIIRNQQDEATHYEQVAIENLKQAIVDAQFYVDGEHFEIKGGDAKSKLDQALEYLVSQVYSELDKINKFADSDEDIKAILCGDEQMMKGTEPNRDAAVKVDQYLEIQFNQHLPTTMSDVQSRFQNKPYGWREIDIAAVVAMLIHDQKVTIKYGGETIQPNNSKLPDMLRKKSEIGKTAISKRQIVSLQKTREVREFLRDYFDEMDVPEDEDGLVAHIVEKFEEESNHFNGLLQRYDTTDRYPDYQLLKDAVALSKEVLSQKGDNTALIDMVIKKEDELFDLKDNLQNVESFFNNQVALFDKAVEQEKAWRPDKDYLNGNEEANNALNNIRLITMVQSGKAFDYSRIPKLNGLLQTVETVHSSMLDKKREELNSIIDECVNAIQGHQSEDGAVRNAINDTVNDYNQKRAEVIETQSLALLDGMVQRLWDIKDDAIKRIEAIKRPTPVKPVPVDPGKKVKAIRVKEAYRQVVFPLRTLKSEDDIDKYVEQARRTLKNMLDDNDQIELK